MTRRGARVRAAWAIRIGTERQADNTSIPNQLERTADYIEAQAWAVASTPSDAGVGIGAKVGEGVGMGLGVNAGDGVKVGVDEVQVGRRG